MRSPLMFGMLLLALLCSGVSSARAGEVLIPPKLKGVLLSASAPYDIPPQLTVGRSQLVSKGIYRLTINPKTGGVDEVGVLNRAPNRKLDAMMVLAFMKWKFAPGTIKQLDVPVTFSQFTIDVDLKDSVKR